MTNYTVNVYNDYLEEEGIRAFSDELGANLIAMTTSGRTGMAHLLFGSIAEEIAHKAHTPVLTFNPHC